MRVRHQEDELADHDRGLDHDLPRLLQRRGLLRLVAGASLITLVGCAGGETGSGTSTSSPGAASSPADGRPSGAPPGGPPPGDVGSDREVSAGEIPEETAGPYPADGSNGANVLSQSGVVRSDLTASFGSSTTTKAEGVPLAISMTLQNYDQDLAPYAGAAVYLWHCDRAGQYSMYSAAVRNENYLRGVQPADERGQVRFTTIFPACYSGRWPHIHFEVYPSLAKATSSQNKIATSQMALPEEACRAVYATAGYEQSVRNLGQVSLATDSVFGDGYKLQIPTVNGNAREGYRLAFTCAV